MVTDLASIVGALKPRQQTERLKILAALYVAGGTSTAVTIAQIFEPLQLQFGKRAPDRNRLSGRLRRYSADARLVEMSPQRWRLTDRGLKWLRTATGLPLPTEHESDRYSIDVAVVCALEHPELAAVLDAMGGAAKWQEVGDARYPHIYRQTELVTHNGEKLSLVATAATSMGLTAASIVTTQLIFQFKPRLVVMIGIAGGTRDGGKEFGDVLVADPSVDYASGKLVNVNGVRGFQPDPYPIGVNPRIRTVLQKYRGKHPLFEAIRKEWTGKLPTSPNRLHTGPLGAADQVIDDAERVVEIKQYWRKLIGVEMETYAVYRACHEAPDPQPRFISFKSVCDFAAEKSDSWQAYAAFVAAQFALTFLKTEWEALWFRPSEK